MNIPIPNKRVGKTATGTWMCLYCGEVYNTQQLAIDCYWAHRDPAAPRYQVGQIMELNSINQMSATVAKRLLGRLFTYGLLTVQQHGEFASQIR